MVKRGKLSSIEKFYIEGNANLPVDDIATELDRSVNIVQKHLDAVTTKPAKKTKVKKKAQKQPKDPQFQQLMGRKERKGEKVATVMTRSASELADDQRPKRLLNKKVQSAIHKPRG